MRVCVCVYIHLESGEEQACKLFFLRCNTDCARRETIGSDVNWYYELFEL